MECIIFLLFFQGFGQTIFIQAEVATEIWSDELLDDESENYKQLSEMIKTKVRDLSELHEKTRQFILIIIFWRVLFYFFYISLFLVK